MRLLLIGGTSFLGRHVASDALRRGWAVTTFNRGRTGPDVEGVEALRGDRSSDDDLATLAGREFDVVVDTCGFVPGVVGRSAAVLAGSGAHYVLVSSISATTTWPRLRTADGAPGQDCPSGAGREDGDYGRLKAGCERAVTEVFGGRATLARAGLILGPHENVGRLPWWLDRISRGGEVLAPGSPDTPMQLVDARDLASFLLDSGETGRGGTYNATGPRGNATMGSWLGDCVTVTGSDAELTWVDDETLLAHDVTPWTELPLWMPRGLPGADNADHVWDADTGAAESAGLRCRPVTETVRDTWAWMQAGGRPPDRPPHAHLPGHGIDPEKERRILAAALGSSAVTQDARAALLEQITTKAVVHGKVVLSSGREADYYVDLRRVTLDGTAAPLVGEVMLDLTADVAFDAVGGLTLGADPVAAAMLHAAAARGRRLDAFVVRKEGKAHGLQRRIEGPDVTGRRVLAVEDTSTTGGSVLTAVEALREAGAEVVGVAVIVERGAAARVRGAGLPYLAAYGLADLGLT